MSSKCEPLTIIGGKGPTPTNWKVCLGDKDISGTLRGIKLHAFVNELITVELHMIVEVDRVEIVHLQVIDPSDDDKELVANEPLP